MYVVVVFSGSVPSRTSPLLISSIYIHTQFDWKRRSDHGSVVSVGHVKILDTAHCKHISVHADNKRKDLKCVVLDHCFNEGAAVTLKNLILAEFADANVRIEKTSALCSFYAEKGGLMIGFERG
mgnify:CR=1 FL=1